MFISNMSKPTMKSLAFLVILTMNFFVVENRRIKESNYRVAIRQGPNTCLSFNIPIKGFPGLNNKFITDCRFLDNINYCGEILPKKFECCPNYHSVKGYKGCRGVSTMNNLIYLAKTNGAAHFVELLEIAGLTKKLENEGPFTLFAPSNHAYMYLAPEKMNQFYERKKDIKENPILLHIVPERILIDDLKNDRLFATLYKGYNIKINIYNNTFATVNCNLILRKAIHAKNGILYVIDRVIDDDLYLHKTLGDAITKDSRFMTLTEALQKSDKCWKKLKDPTLSLTFLAPTDEAFQKLPNSKLNLFLNDPVTREALINNHILTSTVCFQSMFYKRALKTNGNERLHFNCTNNGFTINGQRVLKGMTIAENGILYMVDDLILPNTAKSLVQLTEKENLHTFKRVVEVANLKSKLENTGNITILAPSEEAMNDIPTKELDELLLHREKAVEFVMQHVIYRKVLTNRLISNRGYKTLNNKNESFRTSVHQNSMTIEGALILKRDITGYNGCLHVINKPIKKPIDIYEFLSNLDETYEYFSKGLREMYDKLNAKDRFLTIFAVPDSTFKLVNLDLFKKDQLHKSMIMRQHIMSTMITTDMLKPGKFYEFRTRNRPVYMAKTNGTIIVQNTEMMMPDIITSHGVLHLIKGPISIELFVNKTIP